MRESGGVGELGRRVLVELVVKLVDLGAGEGEGFSAGGGHGVDAAAPAGDVAERGFEEAGVLEAVEERVESSGADAIAVVSKLLHHGETEDGLVRRVGEHVDADEAEVKFALVFQHKTHVNAMVRR